MDADFSHQPKYLPDLAGRQSIAPSPVGQPVDVMIGSRYVPGGGIEGWPLKRHLMSRGVNLYARWLLGLKPKDCSGGYRCYRRRRLAKLDFDPPVARLFVPGRNPLAAETTGAWFGETPITFAIVIRAGPKLIRESWSALRVIGHWGGAADRHRILRPSRYNKPAAKETSAPWRS